MSSGRAFLGHAGEAGFSFEGDGNCWGVPEEGGVQCPPSAVPSSCHGGSGKGTGLSGEQLAPGKCVAHPRLGGFYHHYGLHLSWC